MNLRRSFDPCLYLVLDPTIVKNRDLHSLLEQAIFGGVSLVQIREKNCSQEEFESLARNAASLLKSLGIPFLINDRVDIALSVGADGVHLGQSDLPWTEARRILGSQAIVGVSVENLQQVKELEKAEIDYLGVSSVFQTSTKKNIKHVWGLEGLKEIRKQSSQTLVGIGGIDLSNAKDVFEAGADGIAVVAAICCADDPRQISQLLRMESKK